MIFKFSKQEAHKWLIFFLAELFATLILLYLGCLGCVDNFELFHATPVTKTLVFAFTIIICVNIFGCVSMAHMNPVVTLTAYMYKMIDFPTAIAYVLGQLIGFFLGYSLMRLSVLDEYLLDPNSFCMNLPGPDLKRAFLVEFMITFILIMFVCGVWDPRNSQYFDSVGIRFGLGVFALAYAGGPFSGGSLNPARSFAPALYNWNWKNHWIYWVAPFLASFVATSLFRFVFYPKEVAEGNVEERKTAENGV